MTKHTRSIFQIVILCLGLLACCAVFFANNNPWPAEIADTNTFFSSITGKFKTLDPATSYYEHEGAILDNIVEMPFEYHYLKRPYQLIPMLAEEVPSPTYFDKSGHILEGEPDSAQVARAEYEIKLKPGVMYQPHPCFAKDANGAPLYFGNEKMLAHYSRPCEFPEQSTRELTAEDFKVALVRLCDPDLASPVYSNFKSFLAGMEECQQAIAAAPHPVDYRQIPFEGMEILGKHRFKVILKRKYPQALYWMAMHFFSPVPWEAVAFYNAPQIQAMGLSLNNWPVGTGAFYLESFEQDAKIVLRRNPNHRPDPYPSEGETGDEAAGLLADAGRQTPFLDSCFYLFERESLPGWLKFTQGYYDVNAVLNDVFDTVIAVGPDGSMGLSQEMKKQGISLSTSVRLTTYYYGFNMLDRVFGGIRPEQKKLRQAISILIDTKNFVDIFANGRGTVAQSVLPPGLPGGDVSRSNYNPFVFQWDEMLQVPERLPLEKAKQLLAEAGYPNGIGPDGKRLQLAYDHSSAGNPGFKSQFLWLKDRLAQAGIELLDNGTDGNRFRDKINTGNWQFMYKGWVADYPDPENFLFLFYSPNGTVASKGRGSNYTNYCNPEYDKYFTQLESMTNSPEREKLIAKANQILREDSPCVWAHHPTSFNLTHHWLKNFKPHEIGKTFLKYRKIDVDERKAARQNWNKPPRGSILLAIAILTATLTLTLRTKHDSTR